MYHPQYSAAHRPSGLEHLQLLPNLQLSVPDLALSMKIARDFSPEIDLLAR